MRLKIIKTVVILLIIFIPATIFTLMKRGTNARFPVFISVGIVAACIAVVKYNPEKKEQDTSDDN